VHGSGSSDQVHTDRGSKANRHTYIGYNPFPLTDRGLTEKGVDRYLGT
jgi:hypothetical protein